MTSEEDRNLKHLQ
jgi:hypothetical protein